jgi:hypothetical protein
MKTEERFFVIGAEISLEGFTTMDLMSHNDYETYDEAKSEFLANSEMYGCGAVILKIAFTKVAKCTTGEPRVTKLK